MTQELLLERALGVRFDLGLTPGRSYPGVQGGGKEVGGAGVGGEALGDGPCSGVQFEASMAIIVAQSVYDMTERRSLIE